MDPYVIREDFPELRRIVNGHPLAYLDNAASSLKPRQVIEAICRFYSEKYANVGRGVHTLAREATEAYEEARQRVAAFIGARSDEIVFVRNATEALNLVALGWARWNLRQGDVVVTTVMEHHSNLLPWVRLADELGLELRIVPVHKDGTLDYGALEEAIEGAKLVAVTHKSNVLGVVNDVERIATLARRKGAKLVLDGAQSVPHMPIDVRELGCDFLAFSGHKMLGPTGIGVLYAKRELLEEFKPVYVGGGIIGEVHCTRESCKATWAKPPAMLEAGTPNIVGAIGLAAAVEYLERVGMKWIADHEKKLTKLALELLEELEGVSILGPHEPDKRPGVVSFVVKDLDPHAVAVLLDQRGIAVRSGLHCAQPLHEALGVPKGSVRASFYLYNTEEEIERLVSVVKEIAQ